MNNTIQNNKGNVVGFKCSQCGDVKDKMWGNVCNSCRDSNTKHKELLAEVAKLNDQITKIQGGNNEQQ